MLQAGLSTHVKACRSPGMAFDFGAYNVIKTSQVVKGEPLLDIKAFIYAMLDLLLGLRIHFLQLEKALQAVNAEYSNM